MTRQIIAKAAVANPGERVSSSSTSPDQPSTKKPQARPPALHGGAQSQTPSLSISPPKTLNRQTVSTATAGQPG
jgi:hypothetical protein